MSPATFKQTIDSLELTTADVALMMGVTQRSVQHWLSGTSPVPQPCALILQGIYEGLLTIEWVGDKLVLELQIN